MNYQFDVITPGNSLIKNEAQKAINAGDEYLPNGRRNFFSPITQYKVMKAEFYTEDNRTFKQTEVPIDKWEVDMVCKNTEYNSDSIWDRMNARLARYQQLEDQEPSEPEYIPCSPTAGDKLADSFNFANIETVYNTPMASIFEYDSIEDDISLDQLIETELKLVDNIEGEDFKRAQLLDEIVKLDTIKETDSVLERDNRGEICSHHYRKILFYMNRSGSDYISPNQANNPLKQSLKNNISFLKKVNLDKINQYKKFDYSSQEAAGIGFSKENVIHHLEYIIEIVNRHNFSQSDFEEMELNIFQFLKKSYIIKRRQKICLIPSGGGKTTLFSKYHRYTMDIDFLRVMFNDDEFFYFCFEYSRIFNRWHVLNGFWKMVIFRFQKLFLNRVLLVHSLHQLPFFSLGIKAIALIPRKNENYDVRLWKENCKSIQEEGLDIINDHQNLSFLRIYENLIRDNGSYNDHQFFLGKLVVPNYLDNGKISFHYI